MIWSYLRRIGMSKYTALVLRIYVGGFLLYASMSKIPYPAQFAEATANYRLVPYWFLNLGAVILPWVEFVCGLFLIIGFLSRASTILIGGMIVLFNTMILINMYWGASITCGCYDTVGEPIGWKKITENVLMLIFTIQIYYFDRLFTFRRGGLANPARIRVAPPAARRTGCALPMESRSNTNNSMRLLPLCLLVVLVFSCGSKNQFIGTYKAEVKDSPKQAETVLELKANGDGIWKVGDEEVPFSWYIKGVELRVNTTGGGVIVGTIENDAIHITLPGSKTLSFIKSQ